MCTTILEYWRNTVLLTQIWKYKEDDLTDSNAVDHSQDVCIYFLHEAPTCHPRFLCSPLTPLHIPARQSEWNIGDAHNSVSGSNPGSFIVMMQIPSYQQTMLTSSSMLFQELQNYQANIETHSLIFETDKTKAWGERKPVVPVPDDLHHHYEALQICSNWCSSIVFFVHF